MVQFLISYYKDDYVSMSEWHIRTPGPIKRILYAFLLNTYEMFYVSFEVHPLKVVQTADEDDEIELFTQRSVKIFTTPGFFMPVLFMLCELETDYPGEAPRTPT